jgi:cytochrome c5
MLRTSFATGGFLALALLAACSSGSQPAVEAPAPAPAPAETAETEAAAGSEEPTTMDAIYTVAQAQRGEEVFQELCAECHDTEDWTEPAFQGRWTDQSTFQLWYYINDRMPYDNPWSLSRQQVTDVMTYIFQLNDLPAGDDELGTTDDDIDQYWIVWDR